MPYTVQLIEKRAEKDSVTDGADPDTSRIVMDDGPTRAADTLQAAVAAAFGDFDLPLDYFFVGGRADADTAEYISCNRNEDNDGNPVNGSADDARAVALSERGELWLCDYQFRVRYVESRPVTCDELKAAFPSAEIDA